MKRRNILRTLTGEIILAIIAMTIPFPSLNAAAQNGTKAYVLNSNYDTSGYTISTIKVNGKHTKVEVNDDILSSVNQDAELRSWKNYIFVIEKTPGDNIVVIKKNDISSPVNQYALPEGTNPQDIVFKDIKNAYICGLGSNDIFLVDPVKGKIKKKISLAKFADSDGFAEPKSMAIVGHYLFVALQRTVNYAASEDSLIAVIDTKTNKLYDTDPETDGKQAITLSGRNPGFIFYSKETGKIYVSNAGTYDTVDNYGGIEVVDPVTFASEGMFINDDDLNGSPGSIVIYSATKGYVAGGDWTEYIVTPFNPSDGSVSSKLSGTNSSYIPQIALDKEGYLYVTDRSLENPGIIIYKVKNNSKVSGPTSTGEMAPTGIAF